MENPLLVFVSSAIRGLAAERQAAKTAVEAIPLSRPWVFEFTPASSLPLDESYLSNVRACDIFVLLLGQAVTEPVQREVETARGHDKPLLVFLGDAAPADVVTYAQSLGVKYASYADPADLARKVSEAVGDELIRGYRRHQVSEADLGSIQAFLNVLPAVIDTGGGAFVGADVLTGGGRFIGRDQVVNIGQVIIDGGAAGKSGQVGDEIDSQELAAYLEIVRNQCGRLETRPYRQPSELRGAPPSLSLLGDAGQAGV